MMNQQYRLGVIADIHGNRQALEAVLSALDAGGLVDGLLAAGDMIAGPGQSWVLGELVRRGAVMIQGNNEAAIARMANGTAPDYLHTSRQFGLRRWTHEHLNSDELALVCGLPEQRTVEIEGTDTIRICHGSPRDINELVIPEQCERFVEGFREYIGERDPNQLADIFHWVSERVLVFGHTHLPWVEYQDGRTALNSGAVCFPMDGYVGAQFAVLTWNGTRWRVEHHAVPYDLEAYRQETEDSGILETGMLAYIFLQEALTGEVISPDFFKLANQLALEAGCADLPYYRDDVWEEAERRFEPNRSKC